jgi:hypothetical protein
MIVRYYLECGHCHKVTALRIGVGHRNDEPFRLDCKTCSQEIKGVFHVDQDTVEIKGLDAEGASIVDVEKYDHVVTYHPAFPSAPSPLGEDKAFPSIAALGRHGKELIERSARAAGLEQWLPEARRDLQRIIRNYKEGDWSSFENGVRKYIPKDWPVEKRIDKNRALYQVVELVLMPIATSEAHVGLVSSFTEYLNKLVADNRKALIEFIEYLEAKGYLKQTQYDVLDLLPKFLSGYNEYRPIIIDWNPEDPDGELSKDLKIEGRDGFNEMKSLYVDAYEVICRALTIMVGLVNIQHRAHHDTFGVLGNGKPAYKTLVEFHKGNHAPKFPLLGEEPMFQNWLSKTLDSKIRNAIGHNRINHDPRTSQVVYALDKEGLQESSIPYTDFLRRTVAVCLRAHQVGHLAKIIFVVKYLAADGSI